MLAKRRNVRSLLPLMVAVIGISFLVAPVAASFGGSDTPAFAAGETLGGHFAESGVDLTDGECTIRCENLEWPWSYPDGTTDKAYVAGVATMIEEISNNWKITADWDIEYELKAKWWGCIRVEVWYSVRDSSGGWVWGFEIWSDECKSYGTSWVTERGTYGEESDQGFGQDLDDGKTYRFCVELRVKVVNGGAVMAHSYYSDSSPVKLTVNEISWGYLV